VRSDDNGWRTVRRLRERLRAIPVRTVLLPRGRMPPRTVMIRLALALVLATVLWVRVSAETDPMVTSMYRGVTITPHIASGYSLLNSLPAGTIRVDALQSKLRDAPTPRLYVDLTRATSTSPQVVPVRMRDIPPGARVSHSPSTVTVQLEKEVTRRGLPVQILPLNGAPPGFTTPSISVAPSTVTITGPSREVTRVVTVRLPQFDESVTQDTPLTLTPQLFDRSGHRLGQGVVRVSPSTVKVFIRVHPKPFQQLLPVTLDPQNLIGQVAPGYNVTNITVFPQFVQVSSSAQLVTATLTTAPITISGLTATKTFTSTIQFNGPAGVTLRSTQVIVTVSVAPIRGSAPVVTGIMVINKRLGTTITLASPTTTVLYGGSLPALRAVENTPPSAVLDVGNRVPGVYYLLPTINPPPGVKILTLTPPVLRVTITAPPRPHLASRGPTPTPRARGKPTAKGALTPHPSP